MNAINTKSVLPCLSKCSDFNSEFVYLVQLRSRSSKTPPAGGVDTTKNEDNGDEEDDDFGLEDIEDTEP